MRRALGCVLALCLVGAALAQDAPPPPVHHDVVTDGPVTVTLDLDTTEPGLGAPVTLVLAVDVAGETLESARRVRVQWPDVTAAMVDALGEDIVAVEPYRVQSDQRRLQVELRLFDAGTFELPSLTVGVTGIAERDQPVLVTVAGPTLEDPSVLSPVPAEDEDGFPWLLAAGLAGAVLAAAIVVAVLRRHELEFVDEDDVPTITPHERALQALESLVSRRLPEQGEVEPYFVELSEIFRRYIEDRFGLRAPEQTTEEFLVDLRRSEVGRRAIDAAQRDGLQGFLERADLVKFARDEPDLTVCRDAASAAREFVRTTAPPGETGA